MKRILCAFLALFCCVFGLFSISSTVSAAEQVDLHLDAVSAVLMEAETGKILYEQNADEQLPPASITKIMTLLLVMEAIDAGKIKLTDTVTASERAASMGGSQIYLKVGEQMNVEDLLKSVVIASANDAAAALAEHLCGSVETFVEKMNARAQQLGMENTHFENTNGLDDTTTQHYTSARDVAIMSRALIAHPLILQYSSIWMDSIRDGAFGLTNTNRLVRFYPGATGLKTGSTSKAKFCISATAERDGMHLIAVIMGSPTRDIRNEEAKKLLDYGFANFAVYHDAAADLGELTVTGGLQDICRVRMDGFTMLVNKENVSSVTRKVNLPPELAAPVAKGQKIGTVSYYVGEELIGECNVLATETVGKISFFDIFLRMLKNCFGVDG
ncbi:MAG: D-alanyl-D-alanine carboxypeptidase [Clostridia bacterium]|nr:D-alanyl-D-alanine carboxypeptidase [Clostridia bacterium]